MGLTIPASFTRLTLAYPIYCHSRFTRSYFLPFVYFDMNVFRKPSKFSLRAPFLSAKRHLDSFQVFFYRKCLTLAIFRRDISLCVLSYILACILYVLLVIAIPLPRHVRNKLNCNLEALIWSVIGAMAYREGGTRAIWAAFEWVRPAWSSAAQRGRLL